MITSAAFSFSGLAFILIGLYLSLNHRATRKTIAIIFSVANALMLIHSVLEDNHIMASFWSAFLAWNLHTWWNSGGGGSYKKKLRRFTKRFQGRRRTAPQTS